VEQLSYNSESNLQTSDHRPVYSTFVIDVSPFIPSSSSFSNSSQYDHNSEHKNDQVEEETKNESIMEDGEKEDEFWERMKTQNAIFQKQLKPTQEEGSPQFPNSSSQQPQYEYLVDQRESQVCIIS